MFEVNRSLAIIKPRQAFLDWLLSLPIEWAEGELTLAELREDCNVFLIPMFESLDEAHRFMLARWEMIFEGELADWCDDLSYWPETLSLELFEAWFEIEVHSIVADLDESTLEREEYSIFDLSTH